MVLVPGVASGVPAYTVKVHAKNPSRRAALTGVICLHDLHSGDLLAVLDSGWLTALRGPSSVHVYDVDADAMMAFADWVTAELGVAAQTHKGAAEVAAVCNVLLVATWSRRPLLASGEVAAGAHVTSLGADEPGKVELHPDLLRDSLVVTDDERLAADILPATDASVSRVLRGEHPGRTSDDQITEFNGAVLTGATQGNQVA